MAEQSISNQTTTAKLPKAPAAAATLPKVPEGNLSFVSADNDPAADINTKLQVEIASSKKARKMLLGIASMTPGTEEGKNAHQWRGDRLGQAYFDKRLFDGNMAKVLQPGNDEAKRTIIKQALKELQIPITKDVNGREQARTTTEILKDLNALAAKEFGEGTNLHKIFVSVYKQDGQNAFTSAEEAKQWLEDGANPDGSELTSHQKLYLNRPGIRQQAPEAGNLGSEKEPSMDEDFKGGI